MFLGFFSNKNQNKVEELTQDHREEDDFILIDIQAIDFPCEEETQHVAERDPSSDEPGSLSNEIPHTHHIEKSSRRLNWEARHQNIAAIVHDETGHALEIRCVNQGKQLAFWDVHKNTQVYVYRKANTQAFETKDQGVLRVLR